MTEQTFTASAALPTVAYINSSIGEVTVTVEPTLKTAQVKVHTDATEGPLADAVNNTTITERQAGSETFLHINVPDVDSGSVNVVQVGGSTVRFGTNYGSMTTNNVHEGDVWIGGQKVVSRGRVVADKGTIVSGTGKIAIKVQLPAGSSVELHSTSADLYTTGDLNHVRFETVSGDIDVQSVRTISGQTTSGDIEVDRLAERASIASVSGDIEIEAYSGSAFDARTVSGDIDLRATPSASGAVAAVSVSGDITTRGAGRLNVMPRTQSGDVRNR
ncbi:DUF4097 family beta strand repeat-containing protein [Streptomyces chartreusis]|uniref:DUF4097 family beta strand repeat-containing protein n=1 Tax=Streptomyces chartreusis TaxID=1969 RepID=UPI00382AA7E1